jgi:hypothetical protein
MVAMEGIEHIRDQEVDQAKRFGKSIESVNEMQQRKGCIKEVKAIDERSEWKKWERSVNQTDRSDRRN